MKHSELLRSICIAAATLLVAAPVAAQDSPADEEIGADARAEAADSVTEAETIDEPFDVSEAMAEPERDEGFWDIGLGFSAGGGYAGFIDDAFDDFVDPGGGWEARVILGTDAWVAFEASYLGTANELDAVGLADDAYLLGNGASAALRFNLLSPHYEFRPYLLAGAAWMHYSVENADERTAPLRDSDDVFSVPLAGGFYVSHGWLFADFRVQFAPAFDSDLVRSSDDDTNMSTWRAVANLGFELF